MIKATINPVNAETGEINSCPTACNVAVAVYANNEDMKINKNI